mmetsp:Transcript_14647/g.36469  ORF Transcript_14647/g.36469 Transcript_14647/m.36469 type:complete len:2268 (-) Transcript_14647:639-7442(-)
MAGTGILGACALVITLVLVLGQGSHAAEQEGTARRAFLEGALPLKPLVTTPAELLQATGAPIQVAGRQALQVVFSRPVIALGGDYGREDSYGGALPFSLACAGGAAVPPGKFRWVTTTIARWDPDVDWPTDLACTFAFNTSLVAYDGATLIGAPAPQQLATTPLTASVSGVLSDVAVNATGGWWDANTGMPDDNLPEVPPDGRIVLQLSYPASRKLLASALRVRPAVPGLTLTVSPCITPAPWGPRPVDVMADAAGDQPAADDGPDEATCVEVRLSQKLNDEARYELVLPAGARYNTLSGALQQEVAVAVGGLRSFRIPLRQDWYQPSSPGEYVGSGTRFRRLDLWLPHGLAADTDLAALAAKLSLCELTQPFSRNSACQAVDLPAGSLTSVDAGRLRLEVAALQPKRKYRVKVGADSSIRDGFGKPLKASQTDFWTNEVGNFMAAPSTAGNLAVLEPQALPAGWPYLVLGSDSGVREAAVWSLKMDTPAEIQKVIKAMTAPNVLLTSVMGTPDNQVGRGNPASVTQITLPLDRASPAHLLHTCCQNMWNGQASASLQLILSTNISASFLVSPGRELHVWATRTAEGGAGPVAGATAWVYGVIYNAEPRLMGSCTTDAEGWCQVVLPAARPNDYYTLYGVVRAPSGDLAFTNNAGSWSPWPTLSYAGALVLDRALVKPGDSLHVTGYVQQKGPGGSLGLPNVTNAWLVVGPTWNATSPGQATRVQATISKEYGSFHATLPVPAGATPGQYNLALYIAPATDAAVNPKAAGGAATVSSGMVSPGSTGRFAGSVGMDLGKGMATPSQPTATDFTTEGMISVGSESVVVSDPRPPTADLTLAVPGWARPNASVPLTASAASYLGSSVAGVNMTAVWSTPKARGLVNLTTDAAGMAAATIDLSALPPANASEAGDSLAVSVEWVGPTRERITRTATVRLEEAPRRLELARTLDTHTPGVRFGVTARVVSNEDGEEVQDVPLTITLAPNASASASCTETRICVEVKSGSGPDACQLALPCMGEYVLEACGAAGSDVGCARLALGRNASDWASAPLRAHDAPVLQANATSYTEGEVAGLSFHNPWEGAAALLMWGNTETPLLHRVLTNVPAGPTTIPVTLGPECRGGCSVAVVLSVPRTPAPTPWASLAGPALPVSKLFDPLAPHSHHMSADLTVVEARALNVTLAVAAGGATTSSGSAAVAVVAPGANATVSVAVTRAAGPGSEPGAPVGDAQVTVVAVDKAVLDLAPYALKHLDAALTLDLKAALMASDSDSNRVAPGAIEAVFAMLLRRLGLDPWVEVDTNVVPGSYYYSYGGRGGVSAVSGVDQNDTVFFGARTSPVTYLPSRVSDDGGRQCIGCFGNAAGGDLAMDGMVAASAVAEGMVAPNADRSKSASTSSSTTSSSSTPSVRLASDFATTPLFVAVRTAADGTGAATFTAPANLGSFVVRAYAVARGGGALGAGEARLIVRRTLSLTPSLPRAVRAGDVFQAGVVVTLAGGLRAGEAVSVLVLVGCDVGEGGEGGAEGGGDTSPLRLTGGNTTLVTLTAGSLQAEARFNLSAAALGSATLRFAAAVVVPEGSGGDGGSSEVSSDALEVSVPVLAQQSAVWVATSFALRPPALGAAGNASGWQEGLDLPDAVPGSGSLDLVAGVGHLPSVAALYARALEAVQHWEWRTGYDCVALATLPAALALYGRAPDAAQRAAAARAFDDLTALTDATIGLQFSERYTSWPRRADIVLNAYAAWVFTAYKPQGMSNELASRWGDAVGRLVPLWKAAAARQLVEDATRSRYPTYGGPPYPYSDWNALGWVRMALGGAWEPPACGTQAANTLGGVCLGDATVRADLALTRHASQVAGKGAGATLERLLLGVALQATGAPAYKPFIDSLADDCVSGLRITGRTAYVAAAPGARDPAGGEVQALALGLLTVQASQDRQPVVQKLAAWVGQVGGGRGGRGLATSVVIPAPPSPLALVLAARALAVYDDAAGSAQPDLTFAAAVANTTLLAAHFTLAANDLAQSSTPWSALPTPPGQLAFSVSGAGEASVAASLHFVPARLAPFPSYRGLWVEAVWQVVDPLSSAPAGPPLAGVALGAVVQLTVQVSSADEVRGGVSVEAALPGGLEPLDPLVAGDQGTGCALGGALGAGWQRVLWWWWWPVCPAQTTRPSSVVWRYERLMAGTHTLSVRAVAATEGVFALPPVTASADLQPEVMGATAGALFTVCDAGCAPQPLPPRQPARPCPSDCSGHGVCNTLAGACVCQAGFSGEACNTQQVDR